jgi:hypothetical protein
MDWKSKFQAGRDSGQEKLNQQAEKIIDEQWPRIQQLFQEKAGPAVIAAVHDDARMESLFKMVYAALPFPIRMVVQEPVFITFCFAHREQLLPH